jgi:predicted transcriptional regulator
MGIPTNTPRVVSAKIPPALLEALREIAAAEDRSLSGELRRAVSEHVARKSRSPLVRDEPE